MRLYVTLRLRLTMDVKFSSPKAPLNWRQIDEHFFPPCVGIYLIFQFKEARPCTGTLLLLKANA